LADYGSGINDIGKNQSLQDYLDQMSVIYTECFRVLKPNRYCCVVIRDITHDRVCYPLHDYTINLCNKCGFILEDLKYVLLLSWAHYDYILIFRKGEPRYDGKMKNKYDEPFWDLRRFHEKADHPAKFITMIPKILISKYTEEGEMVLDPFGGIASTAIAANALKRDWILLELNPAFIEYGKKRLNMINKSRLDNYGRNE
jgi:DNA modification methylase